MSLFSGVTRVIFGLILVAVIVYQISTLPYHIEFLRDSYESKEAFRKDYNKDPRNAYGIIYEDVAELNRVVLKGLIGRLGFIIFGIWYLIEFIL